MKKLNMMFDSDVDIAEAVNDLIDLVNSQQEAIEKLEEKTSGFIRIDKVGNSTGLTINGGGTYDLSKLKPADDKPTAEEPNE
jgi:hypothetical protein